MTVFLHEIKQIYEISSEAATKQLKLNNENMQVNVGRMSSGPLNKYNFANVDLSAHQC